MKLARISDPNAAYAALDRAFRRGLRVEAVSLLRALAEHIEAEGGMPISVRPPVEPAIGFPRNLDGRSWHWLINTAPDTFEPMRLEVWCFSEGAWHRTTGKSHKPRTTHNEPPPLGWAYHSKVQVP